jgi:hypothetical protein
MEREEHIFKEGDLVMCISDEKHTHYTNNWTKLDDIKPGDILKVTKVREHKYWTQSIMFEGKKYNHSSQLYCHTTKLLPTIGEYYYTVDNQMLFRCIVKVEKVMELPGEDGNIAVAGHKIMGYTADGFQEFSRGSVTIKFNAQRDYVLASKEQIQWLDECIAKNRFVPAPDNDDWSILDREEEDFSCLNDL